MQMVYKCLQVIAECITVFYLIHEKIAKHISSFKEVILDLRIQNTYLVSSNNTGYNALSAFSSA